ncbi:MAG TPA: type II toxin-antitoxin system prevent-host-death family antitoxin [Longimicrobium sp.]|nr:type II toxin-antitoxin system prevent-host-death family antitoxin [Longimicrobium sp.]
MKDWKLAEAQQCLGEVLRRAERCGPQRVAGPDGDAVVLSAHDFERLLADAGLSESDISDSDDTPEREPMGFVEFMRTSPLAAAMAAGEISPEEWDRACRIGR